MRATNSEIWNALRAKFPQFASHTAEGTKDFFTERGYEAIRATDVSALDEWYGLTLRVYLQFINESRARDPFEIGGFGEKYEVPFGAILQRMSIDTVKPVSPSYRGLTDGAAPDPFVVRKAKTAERFFKQNFDYQSLITVPDDYVMKEIFINEYGMEDYIGGIMKGLENGYVIQKYLNKLEAINAGINSTEYPLKDTQKVSVTMSDTATPEQLKAFVLSVKNLITAMTISPQTGAFNALGFKDVQDVDRLKMLIRPGYASALQTEVLASTFHDEKLSLPIDFIEVESFGGLVPYADAAKTTRAYEVYNSVGEMIGYATTQGATEATIDEDEVYFDDPNEDVIAVIADKGWIFEGTQNPYTVEPIRNPRGRYTNFWASSPGNTVAVDPLYNVVVIEKAA